MHFINVKGMGNKYKFTEIYFIEVIESDSDETLSPESPRLAYTPTQYLPGCLEETEASLDYQEQGSSEEALLDIQR